jgi:hypothetical membrane protein
MNKRFALAGLVAVLLSSATIISMAARRTDGYSHLTKAVSELGSVDAPDRLWFNWLGYILPGLLISGFSYGLSRAFRGALRHQLPFGLLALSGLFLTLAGVFPMDMDHRSTLGSVLHTVGSLGSGLAWMGCVATLAPPLARQPAWAGLPRRLWMLTGAAIAVVVLLGIVSPGTPALGQRVSFAAYFLSIALLAVRLYSTPSLAPEASPVARKNSLYPIENRP